MTDFWIGLGDFFTTTFKIFPVLENIPNIIFIVIGIAGFLYWMIELNKFRKNDVLE
ncbi:MAG: hypothetical protein ABFR62_08630 [Bacteroidota bacterium]